MKTNNIQLIHNDGFNGNLDSLKCIEIGYKFSNKENMHLRKVILEEQLS